MDALTLLSGDAQAFAEKVWASRPHLHHADPADLVGLLSLADVDGLLTSGGLRTPSVRVVQDGTVLPATRFTRRATMAGTAVTGLVDSRKVLDLFGGGATVVLQGLHRYWAPLTDLVRSLELALGHPCQANAYLTPPGSQGFARHADSHDVFVFQTHGRKLWEIVEEGVEREVLLEPGLSMYLPTGTPHSARSQQETSLHVTVGINRLSWRQALRAVVEDVLADPTYDAPLPAGYAADPTALAEGFATALPDLAAALAGSDPAGLARTRQDAFLTERTPVLGGGLLDLVALGDLGDDTELARRDTAALALRPEGDRLRVLLGDREMRVPLRLLEPLRLVAEQPRFHVRELEPWLDEESRAVVCRRLVREGLLRIVR